MCVVNYDNIIIGTYKRAPIRSAVVKSNGPVSIIYITTHLADERCGSRSNNLHIMMCTRHK